MLLINAMVRGGPVYTGVRVVHADDESYMMMPQGHSESGWNSFGAYENDEGRTVDRMRLPARANDPVYGVGFRPVGSTERERTLVLKPLGAHCFGANEPAELQRVCVDPKCRWSRVMNSRHDPGARFMLYAMTAPGRWARGMFRGRS